MSPPKNEKKMMVRGKVVGFVWTVERRAKNPRCKLLSRGEFRHQLGENPLLFLTDAAAAMCTAKEGDLRAGGTLGPFLLLILINARSHHRGEECANAEGAPRSAPKAFSKS